MIVCPRCSRQMPDNIAVCTGCGLQFARSPVAQQYYAFAPPQQAPFPQAKSPNRTVKLITTIVAVAFFVMAAIFIALYALTPSTPGPGGGWGKQTPTGVIMKAIAVDAKNEKLTFGTFNPDTKWVDLKLLVDDGKTTLGFTIKDNWELLNFTQVSGGNPTIYPSGSDLAGDSEVFSGDYINIRVNGNGFTSGQTYTVQILYIPTGIMICEKAFTR